MSNTAPQPIQAARPVPSVGRTVHQYAMGSPGGEFAAGVPRAAIVTGVDEPDNPESPLSLFVITETGSFHNPHTPYGPGQPGHWGWPVFVPPR